jgi:group II intron reverse transcriptase/maturase
LLGSEIVPGPHREPERGKTMMHEQGKSDRPIVPGTPANQPDAPGSAKRNYWDIWEQWIRVEYADKGKGLAEEKAETAPQGDRTQRRVRGASAASEALSQALDRIRQAARRDKGLKFTSLWHHVYAVDRLREAYLGLARQAAPGEDGRTWQEYGKDLEVNLRDLSERLARGAYRAWPVKRVYIPKADGRKRPIGMPVIEDKIVQRATTEVLNAIYEEDFLGFSHGFRPGRRAHDALDALTVAIQIKKVNWILDADIRSFFDTLSHEWLVRFVEHRIADPRVVRHIRKWLNAGVLEEGVLTEPEEGTPQGGSISPLLANIYLHYALDLWAEQWRRTKAHGDVIIVRYADDFVVGFQHESDARRFHEELRERFRRFNLELAEEKTRVIEFGRYAAERRSRRGDSKPPTFNFLGFTHICGKTRKGAFRLLRQTIPKRMRGKLQQVKQELKRRIHEGTTEVGRWLAAVAGGHYRYYGVPGNEPALRAFGYGVYLHWWQAICRLSQKGRITLERMNRIAARWLPSPRAHHPYPAERLTVNI